jgi:hypothetical protein
LLDGIPTAMYKLSTARLITGSLPILMLPVIFKTGDVLMDLFIQYYVRLY